MADPAAEAVYAGSAPARPDLITYGSLLAALERGGQWERALAVFEEMQARGITVRPPGWPCWLAARLAGWQAGWPARLLPPCGGVAWGTPDCLLGRRLDPLISTPPRPSQPRLPPPTLPSLPPHPPPQPNGYHYTSVLNACEQGGQWDTAVRLFKAMQRRSDIPLRSMAMVARKAL